MEPLVSVDRNTAVFSIFSKIAKKNFNWQIFFNFTSNRHLLILMCFMHAKDNKIVANSGYKS